MEVYFAKDYDQESFFDKAIFSTDIAQMHGMMKVLLSRPVTNESHIFVVDVFYFAIYSKIDDFSPFLPLVSNTATSL